MLCLRPIKSYLTLIMLLSFAQFVTAQDTLGLRRPAYKLNVAVDKETFYEDNIISTPYILPDTSIQLYPGETIYVEVIEENGVIKKMTAVPVIKDPAKTITINFSQEKKGKVHELMMLKIENPFPYQLIYKALVFPFPQKRWLKTDVLPVEPRLSAYESWPNIIISIALRGWTFQHE